MIQGLSTMNALLSIALLSIMLRPGQAHSEEEAARLKHFPTDPFLHYVDDCTEAVIFVVAGSSCNKLRILSEAMRSEVEQTGVRTVTLMMLNRLTDSTAFPRSDRMEALAFATRAGLRGWAPDRNENAWYYYHVDSAKLSYCQFTARGSKELLLSLCRGNREQEKQLRRTILSVLDENSDPIVQPTMNAYIRDSIIVVGSGSALKMRAYNIYTGKQIWDASFVEELFSHALGPGETLATTKLFHSPEIIAAEWCSDSSVICIGTIVSERPDASRGRNAIGKRSFIADIDPRTLTVSWVKRPADISPDMEKISLANAQSRYPLLFTTQCPWSAKGDAVYEQHVLRAVDLETREVSLFVKMDSAYRTLGIEDNIADGLFCTTHDGIWTAQPLSPSIQNEHTGDRLYLDDDWYEGYREKLKGMAEETRWHSGSAFQRQSLYEVPSVIAGLFTTSGQTIAALLYKRDQDGGTNDFLEIYDRHSKRKLLSRMLSPGWSIQMAGDRLLRVELIDDEYVVALYTFE
jgi:hypothetical protein